jgi:glycosyltransferase involved in cell wall biosynthesis
VSGPRIAIVSPGIGRVQRGFERLFGDLFQLVRDEFDVTLLKGGGSREADERVPLFIHRNSPVMNVLPVHRLFGRTPYHSECMLFALGMLPWLRAGRFDIVNTIDPPLTRLLYRMRARLGLSFTLLYTEATLMAPSDYPPADHTHFIGRMGLDQALAYGYRPDTLTLVPCGIYPERFETPLDKAMLRRAYGIPEDKFVILSVAAINRNQKRTDYLVDEVAALDGNWLLMLDGSLDHGDPDLVSYARRKLGARVRFSQVASDKVAELYKLADVMTHVSMFESFGIAIVEAASTGMPVIIHDGPHFRWLLPNPASWIDASRPGALTARLRAAMSDPATLDAMRVAPLVRDRFSWHKLKPDYAALYRHVASLPRQGVAEADCRRVA